MRVAFLVAELGRSGGMGVIRDWARRLDDAVLVVCGTSSSLPSDDDGVPVRSLASMADAPVDVAIATWWTTCELLWDVAAQRRAVLLQSLESLYYRDHEAADRIGAGAIFDLPVAWLPIAPHLAGFVEGVAPGAPVHPVPLGTDKDVFTVVPPRSEPGPLRVLVEGQPSMWFKGVAEAVAAVRRMRSPATVTVVAADPGAAGDLGADRVCGGLAPAGMAALYGEHDVLLKLSRLEGRPLPVLEALHVGRPCVVTPLPGLDGVIEHGVNGLVVGVDDEPGTTEALERLAGDDALRLRLGDGALVTAARLPSRDESARAFETALGDLLAAPPQEPDLARLAHGNRRAIELARIEEWRRRGAEAEAARWHEGWRDAAAENAEYDRWSRELRARIDELQRRPAARAEARLRELLGRGG